MLHNRDQKIDIERIKAALASMPIEDVRLLVQEMEAELRKPAPPHLMQ
jgi:hypothetical protein